MVSFISTFWLTNTNLLWRYFIKLTLPVTGTPVLPDMSKDTQRRHATLFIACFTITNPKRSDRSLFDANPMRRAEISSGSPFCYLLLSGPCALLQLSGDIYLEWQSKNSTLFYVRKWIHSLGDTRTAKAMPSCGASLFAARYNFVLWLAEQRYSVVWHSRVLISFDSPADPQFK